MKWPLPWREPLTMANKLDAMMYLAEHRVLDRSDRPFAQ